MPIKIIAKKAQQHYMERFSKEYEMYLSEIVEYKNHELFGNTELIYSIETDVEYKCETADRLSKKLSCTDANTYGREIKHNKRYRQDIVVNIGSQLYEDFMVWPILPTPEEEFDKDDIAEFPIYRNIHNKVEIEIHPFPWQHCNIRFIPDADPALGAINLWFQKWYYPRLNPNPFKQVVHIINGPFTSDEVKGVSYIFDLGTAPPEAFCELIDLITQREIQLIVIE